MAKTRLNVDVRDRLRKFAKDNIAVPKELKAFDAAYAKAAKLVTKAVRDKYPADHMEILERYDVVTRDKSVKVVDPNGRITEFRFRDEDRPVRPRNYHHREVFKSTNACLGAIDDWELKSAAYETARAEILRHYHALIEASRYVEDVIEVWPASSTILTQFLSERGKNLPAAVSDETIAFVRKNNAGATKEAA